MPKKSTAKRRVIRSPNLTQEEMAGLDGAPVLEPEQMDKAIIGTVANVEGELLLVYSFLDMVEVTKNLLEKKRRRDRKQQSLQARKNEGQEPSPDAATFDLGQIDFSKVTFEDDEGSLDEDTLYEEANDYTSYEYLSYISGGGPRQPIIVEEADPERLEDFSPEELLELHGQTWVIVGKSLATHLQPSHPLEPLDR